MMPRREPVSSDRSSATQASGALFPRAGVACSVFRVPLSIQAQGADREEHVDEEVADGHEGDDWTLQRVAKREAEALADLGAEPRTFFPRSLGRALTPLDSGERQR